MVYAFTPKGDLRELPLGSTHVDFADAVHTEVGNQCTGARVNGKLVPLDYQLKSGDRVEIITSAGRNPSRDWLSFVKTSRAKTKIRSWLNTKEREQSKAVGKSICERKFKQHRLDFQKMFKSGKLEKALLEIGFKNVEELYISIGFGKTSVNELLKKIIPKEELRQPSEKESRMEKIIKTLTGSSESGVLVKGYNDVLIRYPNCCTPVPGESVVGYITRGRGITIHREGCPQLLNVDPVRKIEVKWDPDYKGPRAVTIEVVCVDRPGMLSNITSSIASADINISKAEVHSTSNEKAVGTFEIAVSSLNQLESVMKAIGRAKGVISVERIAGREEG